MPTPTLNRTASADHPIRLAGTSYADGEFVLLCEAVATAPDPDRTLNVFLETRIVPPTSAAGIGPRWSP